MYWALGETSALFLVGCDLGRLNKDQDTETLNSVY